MKSELTKHFVRKLVKKGVIFAFLMIVVTAVGQSIAPIVTNNLALTQMQNSDEMFVAMETYSKLKPIVNITYAGIFVWFGCGIVKDICKFNKSINTTNEKEN